MPHEKRAGGLRRELHLDAQAGLRNGGGQRHGRAGLESAERGEVEDGVCEHPLRGGAIDAQTDAVLPLQPTFGAERVGVETLPVLRLGAAAWADGPRGIDRPAGKFRRGRHHDLPAPVRKQLDLVRAGAQGLDGHGHAEPAVEHT